MNLTAIAAAVSAALAGAAGFALAWNIQAKIILDNSLEVANERIARQQATRSLIERNQAQLGAAQAAAQSRVVVLAADLGRNRTELDRVRIASETAMRSAASGLDACIGATHAYHLVSTQCTERLVEMGRNADGHASDTKTLMDAWPR